MRETIDLKLRPEQAADEQFLEQKIASRCGCSTREIDEWRLLRRSIDARGRQPLIHLRVEVFRGEKPRAEPALLDSLKQVDDSRRALIVGAGPAGYFAALEMLELGIKPLVLDRGKDVRSRRRDLRSIQQFGEVNPHSNYCFGEGGAGTYSDGKLYTRSHKRGTIDKAMRLLVEHGAKSDILVDAHPHIGSNKLPGIVANIRETILAHGGEVHFGHHVTDLLIEKGEILGVVVNEEKEYRAGAVVLATGHSARDIYYLLREKGVRLEAKPFALGVRVEHPQSLIDAIQYNQRPRERHLPAASYRLAC
ncbi:MAG: FAD-binding protein, partial [Saprospiraceae bacterium]|nr:FAD-binding protein [Saprospiraceae bacterium]